MAKINIEAYQCDFCEVKELQLPACLKCGKNFCPAHGGEGNVHITVGNDKIMAFKFNFEHKPICKDCAMDHPNLLRAIAVALGNEADKLEVEPKL